MLKDMEPSLISFGCFTQMFFGPGISRMFRLQFHSSIHFSWKIILKQVWLFPGVTHHMERNSNWIRSSLKTMAVSNWQTCCSCPTRKLISQFYIWIAMVCACRPSKLYASSWFLIFLSAWLMNLNPWWYPPHFINFGSSRTRRKVLWCPDWV